MSIHDYRCARPEAHGPHKYSAEGLIFNCDGRERGVRKPARTTLLAGIMRAQSTNEEQEVEYRGHTLAITPFSIVWEEQASGEYQFGIDHDVHHIASALRDVDTIIDHLNGVPRG